MRPYPPSAPARLEPAAGAFQVDGLGSLSLCSSLPEWSSAARTPQGGELLLGASWLLLVPDRPPAASTLVLVASSATFAPPGLFPQLVPPQLLWVNDLAPTLSQIAPVVVGPLVLGPVVRFPHSSTPRWSCAARGPPAAELTFVPPPLREALSSLLDFS